MWFRQEVILVLRANKQKAPIKVIIVGFCFGRIPRMLHLLDHSPLKVIKLILEIMRLHSLLRLAARLRLLVMYKGLDNLRHDRLTICSY